jgi:hypothetical protein
MHPDLIRRLAVIAKNHYPARLIDDLFILAGAEPKWWEPLPTASGSERMDQVYGWVEALKRRPPENAERILEGAIVQILENEAVDTTDRNALRRHLHLPPAAARTPTVALQVTITVPDDVEKVLEIVIKGLPRAMFPLKHRRGGQRGPDFSTEYDVQDLLHALLRPWIKDIRVEEWTPSYAGSSGRIDFLFPQNGIVVETKLVRDARHAKRVGDELIVDIARYAQHPTCRQLWFVIYDPAGHIQNPDGFASDLERADGAQGGGRLRVRTFVLGV